MHAVATSDAQAFWDTASDFLLGDPIVNNVLVTVVTGRRTGAIPQPEPATYVAVYSGTGSVVGAAMRTPPHNVYVSAMPADGVESLVDAILSRCADARGVTGTVAEARAFAEQWVRRTGASAYVTMCQRIHRLDAVTPPPEVPGRLRLAGPGDRDLLVAWTEAFAEEVGEAVSGDAAPNVDARLAERRALVWEVDGVPVSYVGTSLPVSGVVRIGPVYTPFEHRRRGYATTLVAGASQRALDDGARACSLYTDVANPTSNKIYAAVGYRPVCDVTMYRFAPA